MNTRALDGPITEQAQSQESAAFRSSGACRTVIRIRVADTFPTRLVGLLARASLDPQEGLLFDPGGSIHTMWMRFPIDVVFLDERYRILRIASRVPPWRFVLAPRQTRFVLELAAGVACAADLERGTMLARCRQELTVALQGSSLQARVVRASAQV